MVVTGQTFIWEQAYDVHTCRYIEQLHVLHNCSVAVFADVSNVSNAKTVPLPTLAEDWFHKQEPKNTNIYKVETNNMNIYKLTW
jgi:hypothetical protein